MLGVTIGVGIVVFLLMFFSSIIDKEKHKHIRTFFLMICLPLLFLIPASLVLESNVCEVVVVNESTYYVYGDNFTDYHWDYTFSPTPQNPLDAAYLFHEEKSFVYDTYCYDKADGSRTFIIVFSIILVVFMIYITIMLFSDIIALLKDLIKKV